MKTLILSLTTARAAQVRADVARLREDGADVTLVVTKPADWEDVGDGVTVVPLADAESRHPLLRTERFLVLVLPRLVYTLVARTIDLTARVLPGRLGRRVARSSGQWKKVWVRVRGATRRFHKERWGGWYSLVRPWFLWRTARRTVLPEIGTDWDVIVVADSLSTPIGWKLARANPHASVGFSLEEALEDRAELDA